jgi:predicted branched-subunit amino acid permease
MRLHFSLRDLLWLTALVAALIAFHLLHMIAPLTVGVTVFLVAAAILIPKKNKEIREKLASEESSDTF